MKAISKMTTYERAICLFRLLPEDIGDFIVNMRVLAEKIAAREMIVHRKKNSREKIDDWPAAARKMCEIIDGHQKEILGNATLFANYLLGNGLQGFTLYCLEDYIAEPGQDQTNFYFAVKLLLF